jgi:DNA ligase (NAD+)
MGELKAAKLLQELLESKKRPLSRFITGLGIPGVGEVAARDLASSYRTLENLRKAEAEQLSEMKGIGPVTAFSLASFFRNPETGNLVDDLVRNGFSPFEEVEEKGTSLSGETIVFTGTLSMPRPEAKKLAEAAGAKVTGSVTGSTTMVVAGENAGSKLDKARSLGVAVVSEEEFMSRVTEN